MNHDLKQFVLSVAGAVVPALALVASIAFLSIPLSLGHHPGDSPAPQTALVYHLT